MKSGVVAAFRSERVKQRAWDTNGQRTPEYKVALIKQTELWMRGILTHNEVTGECCADFSCCHADLLTPQPQRNEKGIKDIARWCE